MENEEILLLKRQVTETRAKRLDAQRKASRLPAVAKAAARLERDSSSGITLAINEARNEIQELNDQVMECAQGNDQIRRLFKNAAKVYPGNTQRDNLVRHLNDDARWRRNINALATGEIGLKLPVVKEF